MKSPVPNILVVGGSGFLSGSVAQVALTRGYKVTVVTRGLRPLPPGVSSIIVDRGDRASFAQCIANSATTWDVVVDAIPYSPEDARQDLDVFSRRAGRLVLVSTDFVYDPNQRRNPQNEHDACYVTSWYGGRKRQAEQVVEQCNTGLPWTILRPTHIYGPGSPLGCLPSHSRDPRLIEHILANRALRLVDGGRFLQQPVFVTDVAEAILEVALRPEAVGKVLNVAGPEIISSLGYYQTLGELLGRTVMIENIATKAFLTVNPDKAPLCCDRVYDLSALRATGVPLPATSLRSGLRQLLAPPALVAPFST